MLNTNLSKIRPEGHYQNDCWIILMVICFSVFIYGLIEGFSVQYSDIPPSILGYRMYVVHGSSMEPTIMNGSLIIVKEKEAEMIQIDEIITYLCYRSQKPCTTHRVVGIEKWSNGSVGEVSFVTMGDANRVEDPTLVQSCKVVGVVRRIIEPHHVRNITLWLKITVKLVMFFIFMLLGARVYSKKSF
ncbi:signal peptidase I [Tindallia californiensis]|uniref:Signal peptidase I n=1 Tax=Tindallia californiensis TaxID=159292 RepID=A0A1H3II22_9FIRM|nr:signal peptidase I [Tindallia californiensis]SDY27302.1 signal peptidase I [Tindallia californiensis]